MPDELENEVVIPNTRRKVFFGLFVFPMLIAVTMAALLSGIVLLTHEEETPESLIAAIKTGAPSKRWQKAFELSNELNRQGGGMIRSAGVMNEIIHILNDSDHYDPKTRAYMAMALSRFQTPEAGRAIEKALREAETSGDSELPLFLMSAAANFKSPDSPREVVRFLESKDGDLRKTAAYVLGALESREAIPHLKRALEDPVTDVRWNAALSLARFGDDSGLAILLEMLDRSYLQAAHRLNESQMERVMVNAVKGLGLIDHSESLSALKAVAEQDKNLKVRQAALAALEGFNGKSV